MTSTLIENDITLYAFLLRIGGALVIGAFLALIYSIKNTYSKSMLATLIILPAVVSMVIMMVNGSIGVGIAVAGAFSLVRFRSVPGSAIEIGYLFLAMSTGLGCGMGKMIFAGVFAGIVGLIFMLFSISKIGNGKQGYRRVVIMIPENLDYTGVFDDLFEKYTKKETLVRVKTTNMGSMYKLYYDVYLKDEKQESAFINDIRVRNGNLEVSFSNHVENWNTL